MYGVDEVAAGVTGVTGTAVVTVAAGAAAGSAPGLTWTVESSRRAVSRPGGSVPYHPSVPSRGRLRCKVRRTDAGGTSGGVESSPAGRGRKDANADNDSNIACAVEGSAHSASA